MIEKSKPIIIKMWREWESTDPDHTMDYHVQVDAESGKIPHKMFGNVGDNKKSFKNETRYLKFLHRIIDWIRA